MSYIIKCDRCLKQGGTTTARTVPQGWATVGWDISVASGTRHKYHQFCPECVAHLQIETEPTEETSAGKLVAILEAMVDEAMDERAEG